VDRIELVECANEDAVRYQFTSHAIQLITADLTGTSPLSVAGAFTVRDADTTTLQYLGFNTANALFADPAVRQAIGLGIDRSAVVSAYLSGHAAAAQFPVSPASSLYPADLETAYAYDAFETAMTEAGLNRGAAHSVTLLVNSENTFKVSVANYLAAALSVFDLKVTVQALPWEEYQAALTAGQFDLYYGEVRLTADWDLTALVGTGGSLNFGGYTDPALDQMLLDDSAAADRTRSMETVCARLSSQAPILPVCFKRTSVLTQADVVEGLSPTASDPFYDIAALTIHLKEQP
jgi:peptide/nickel transport system substrate-binding protein